MSSTPWYHPLVPDEESSVDETSTPMPEEGPVSLAAVHLHGISFSTNLVTEPTTVLAAVPTEPYMPIPPPALKCTWQMVDMHRIPDREAFGALVGCIRCGAALAAEYSRNALHAMTGYTDPKISALRRFVEADVNSRGAGSPFDRNCPG